MQDEVCDLPVKFRDTVILDPRVFRYTARITGMPNALIHHRHFTPSCEPYRAYAAATNEQVLAEFHASESGLTDHEVRLRLMKYGNNEFLTHRRRTAAVQLLSKFANPLVLVLLLITGISWALGDAISAILVGAMAVISVLLSFSEEYRAGKEAEKLKSLVHTTSTVIRHGTAREVRIAEIVPGDIIELIAGDIVPADVRILQCKDLFINQAALTGESFPAEKCCEPLHPKDCIVTELHNIGFMGSSVVSGTARAIVLRTGLLTQFGAIAKELAEAEPETSFDRGIRELTTMMLRLMAALVVVIFAINALTKGSLLEALLFALAVAVGLTPEMLPMVVALNLSKGAIAMAKKKVIVKHIDSIQNFGAMDVLCTDKTGTLTLDKIVLERSCDVSGKQDEHVLREAYINSEYQTGLRGLLDRTILQHEKLDVHGLTKIDEIPFDFSRKIMSVIVAMEGKHRLIAKGAPEEIFKRCTHYVLDGKTHAITNERLRFLEKEEEALSAEGFRVLAVAVREEPMTRTAFSRGDERALTLIGYLAFLDPPKPTAKETIAALRDLGVAVKILTGDNAIVTKKICGDVGLDIEGFLTGDAVEQLTDEELRLKTEHVTVFARLSPIQKERVVTAMRANGHTVGYMGDGINDAPALKAADVGISVQNAVDIAKESADFILLQKSLVVLNEGILEGRRTFANILKYIRMGTSSSFGNMLSMTGASILLPFLPMLPIQVLLNNFLYDLSQLAIPTDEIDPDATREPRQWHVS
ncbi:magnesium-translocating P-type ATPase, partial [Candidatus Peregrinibacteria bacterium]|nr:magnesium-translocating P-type ATPase [Candidatus Peregrinibacteria bacterium]